MTKLQLILFKVMIKEYKSQIKSMVGKDMDCYEFFVLASRNISKAIENI